MVSSGTSELERDDSSPGRAPGGAAHRRYLAARPGVNPPLASAVTRQSRTSMG
jgi:hypothetical protein